MSESIILKKNPSIVFQLLEDGFELVDEQTKQRSGFYPYSELQSVELNSVWFPRFSNWMRVITCILNGVPYFPDADTYKKANLVFHFKDKKQGIWITDTYMAKKAKQLVVRLCEKTHRQLVKN